MADEKRRLIYELLVEAKGLKQATQQAKQEFGDLGRVVGGFKAVLGTAFAGVAVVSLVKGLIDVNDEITRITASLRSVGVEGEDASQAIHSMQNTAVATGTALSSVASAYKDVADVAETLGLNQQQVADLVDASTRAMVSQGGSAEQAAQQIGVLTFAIEKGGLSQKEFKSIVKENEVLQDAFEVALGKTTAQILEQADASGITADELKRVLEVYTDLGKQQQVPITLASVTASLWEASKAFAAAAIDASGLRTELNELGRLVKPDDAEGWIEWGTKFGTALKLLLPPAMQVSGILTTLIAQQRDLLQQQKEAVAKADAATHQRWAPEDITPAMRRESGGERLTMTEYTAEDRAIDNRIKAASAIDQQARMYSYMEQTMFDLNRYHIAYANSIKVENIALDKNLEIRYDVVDVQKMEQENAEALAKTMEEIGPPQVDFPTLLDDLAELTGAAQVFAHTLVAAFQGNIHNARDFFRTVLNGLAEVAAQKAIINLFDTADEKGGWIKFIGGLFASEAAKGNAYQGGQVVPFAQGGVVSSPTLFPMGGGRTGLMGEAGAEAVMPLRRGSDGRLGVGGTRPSVIVNNQTGVTAEATVIGTSERLEITLRAAQLGARLAESEINRSIRSGYGPTAQSMSRAFGLRRRV